MNGLSTTMATGRRHHIDTWVRHLSQVDQPTTSRPASPASIVRRLSCQSKFYDCGIRDAELLDSSPVANVRRPKVSEDSSTVGLTAAELDRLLTAAETHGARLAETPDRAGWQGDPLPGHHGWAPFCWASSWRW